MAAARRRVVYVVARNLIVLFVCELSRLVVVITFRRGGSGAREVAYSWRCASVQLKKDASGLVRILADAGNS